MLEPIFIVEKKEKTPKKTLLVEHLMSKFLFFFDSTTEK